MIFISTLSTILALTYAFFAFWWYRSLRSKGEREDKSPHSGSLQLSVVIPFRNEAANLPQLLCDLQKQLYPKELYEVILVDDHSSDGGAEAVADFIAQNGGRFSLISSDRGVRGKKAGLAKGMAAAKGLVIVQTDADCRLRPEWLSAMAGAFTADEVLMVLGSVRMLPEPGFWSKFAALEFMSLQAVGAAMVFGKKPIMGSAANMAYRREVLENFGAAGAARASGDDVFLVQAAKERGDINYNLGPAAVVDTAAPSGFAEFVQQRARWGGKTTSYTSPLAKGIAFLVAAMAVWQVLLLVLALYDVRALYLFIIVWLVKAAVDYPLLRAFAKETNQGQLLKIFVPSTLIYPFYILITGMVILFGSVSWKERVIRPARD